MTDRFTFALAVAAASVLLVGMPGTASYAGTVDTWYGSYYQDGGVTGQYSFVSVNNTGTSAQTVTVSFYDSSGAQVGDASQVVNPQAQFHLTTESAGGVAGTQNTQGYITVESDGDVAALQPWSVIIFPGEPTTGFTATWDLR